jgi:hypothetical protein
MALRAPGALAPGHHPGVGGECGRSFPKLHNAHLCLIVSVATIANPCRFQYETSHMKQTFNRSNPNSVANGECF